ncbi:hypothetical protein [Pasteuria penetrans]|uniref:hypothetical protein n=1 Tax=Pasteuria penetrans TaxID=86005 RepID=UPI0011EC3025|nr:hypothetical protein [Pasteuria penetrans]
MIPSSNEGKNTRRNSRMSLDIQQKFPRQPRPRKFTAAIDRLFGDVVENDDKERLTCENKLVFLEIMGHSEELMEQYRKIIVVRSSYKEGDSRELHRRKL